VVPVHNGPAQQKGAQKIFLRSTIPLLYRLAPGQKTNRENRQIQKYQQMLPRKKSCDD